MKKTIIALAALACTAYAAQESVTLTTTFSNVASSSVTSTVSTNPYAFTATTSSQTINMTSGSVAGSTSLITPNINVGNGGTWTETLTYSTAQAQLGYNLSSVDLGIVMYNSSGAVQSETVCRSVSITLSVKQNDVVIATGTWSGILHGNGGSDIVGEAQIAAGYQATDHHYVQSSSGDSMPTITLTAMEGYSLSDLTGNFTLDVTVAKGSDDSAYYFGSSSSAVTSQDLGKGCFYGLKSVAVNATTPEPATATLSLLALAGLAARRRRK